MNDPIGNDRRAEARVSLDGMVAVRVRTGASTIEGHLVNISMRGAYVAMGDPPDAETRVLFEADAGEGVSLGQIPARVTRLKTMLTGHHDAVPAGAGLEFLAASDEARHAVEHFVAAIVSLDLLSYDERNARWVRSIQSFASSTASPDDTHPG